MILYTYRIPYKYGQTIRLKPFFDSHIGHRYSDTKAIQKYLADSDENTYLLGGGDTIDAIITSDLKRYRKGDDATEGQAVIDEQVDYTERLVKDNFKGHIIGLMLGNHEGTILKKCGVNPIRHLCKSLDCKSLGRSCLIKLIFREEKGRGRTLMIYAHHGWGGGTRTVGGSITKYSKMLPYWEADIFLFGHDHKLDTHKESRLSMVGNKLISRPKRMYLCGTFLKTLSTTDEPTYSEEAGFPPVEIGGLNLSIRPDRDWLSIESDIDE